MERSGLAETAESERADTGALPRPAVTPYVPHLLLETLAEIAERSPIRIDPIDGTMLFADVSGFTALSERLAQKGKEGAEILTSIINSYFEQMLSIARARGGDNLKFGGDALLLLFRGEGHAARASGVALEMMRATHRFGAIRFGRESVKLSMSAGVHTGRFWSALVGIPQSRMQQCVLGSAAAALSDAEGAASKGEVMVTAATWAEIEASFAGTPNGAFFQVRRAIRRIPEAEGHPEYGPTVPSTVAPYLPPPVLESARAGEVRALDGEHRKVTTMFISVRGANAMLDAEPSSVALDEMNRYVAAVVALAERHGGYLVSNDIDSYGLKLILIFGAPVGREDPTGDAFRLALGIARERESMGLRLEHRIGINSGFVFCGDLGSTFRRDYTVLGDAVNLSARLMSASADGQILLSEATYNDARSGFVAQKLDPIRVKGKVAPIPIRALIDESTGVPEANVADAPMVGREREVALLERARRKAESGTEALVLVSGEPGIGKSRLVAEVEQILEGARWSVLRGYSFAHTSLTPYEPWIAVLEPLVGITHGLPAESRTDVVRARLTALDPALLDSAPLLNALLGLSFPSSSVLDSLDERTRRERLYDLIGAVLGQQARSEPTMLILEDVQWADDSSLQLLEAVSRKLQQSRLFVCLTARPMSGGTAALPRGIEVIELHELSEEASLALLNHLTGDHLTGDAHLSAAAAAGLLAKCRGNPLFLEEVGRAIGGGGSAAIAVPDRLQSLLMSRIDTLPSATRRAVRLAAVIGTAFDDQILAALALRADQGLNVPLALDDLLRASVILPDESVPGHFRFRHNLLQEVAYESLLYARRRELHRKVGETIEEKYGRLLDPFYETLAHHFEQSAELQKTVEYAVLAGDKARRVFASESAMAFYRQALEAARRGGQEWLLARSLIEERIGDSLEVVGRHSDAAGAHRRALRAWRPRSGNELHGRDGPFAMTRRDRVTREASLRTKIAVALERSSDYGASLRWLDAALGGLPVHSPALEARIRGARSVAYSRRGENDRALAEGQTALAAARRSGETAQIAYAHQVVASAYYEVGQLRQSVRHRSAALRLYESVGDLSRILASHGNLGLSFQEIGQIDRAIEHHQACLSTARRLGNVAAVAIASNNLGEALLIQGRVAEAKVELQRTVDTYREHSDLLAAAGLALVNLSRAHLLEGALVASDEALTEGTTMLRSAGARGLLLQARAQRAELTLEQGDLEAAARHATQSLTDARELGAELVGVKARRVLGRIAALRQDLAGAEELLGQAAETAARLEADYELGLCLLETARVRAATNRGRAAHPARRAARIFRRLGAADLAFDADRLLNRAQTGLLHEKVTNIAPVV